MKGHNPRNSVGKPGGPMLLTFVAAGLFVLFIVVVIYLGIRLETIEEQLAYKPPQITAGEGGGSKVIEITDGQTVYVPVYSHIYSEGGQPFLLETTLSIRNTDSKQPIQLVSVQYFDTEGKLVDTYLDQSTVLQPLQTMEFLVKKQDTRGGSGANFIVVWRAQASVYEPVIEAVMIGLSEGHSISFISPGRALARRDD